MSTVKWLSDISTKGTTFWLLGPFLTQQNTTVHTFDPSTNTLYNHRVHKNLHTQLKDVTRLDFPQNPLYLLVSRPA